MLGAGARRLGEGRLEEHPAHPGDVREHAIEHPPALLVAVEALTDVVAQVAAGLRDADRQAMRDALAGERQRVGMVAQMADQVAGGGKAKPLNPRIDSLVVQFVEPARPRAQALAQRDRAGIDEAPVIRRQGLRRIAGPGPTGETRPTGLGKGRGVREAEHRKFAGARA